MSTKSDNKTNDNLNHELDNKFTIIAVLFVTVLMTSNLMATKLVAFGPLVLPAAVILYPFSFTLGDILAEVWGFRRARQVIGMGFAANVLLVLFTNIAVVMPFPSFWSAQEGFQLVFQAVPRVLLASFSGYLLGELSNAYVLDKMKTMPGSRHLFIRTIGSTIVGMVFDTGVFIFIAFYGAVPNSVLWQMMIAQYVVKVLIEAFIGTPLAYLGVRWVRRADRAGR